MIVLDILGEEGDSEKRKYAKHGKHSCIIFPCQAESQSAESLKELIWIDSWRVKHFRVGRIPIVASRSSDDYAVSYNPI